MSFRLVLKSVTLNDLEGRNGRYIALFQRNLVNVRCNSYIIHCVSKNIPDVLAVTCESIFGFS